MSFSHGSDYDYGARNYGESVKEETSNENGYDYPNSEDNSTTSYGYYSDYDSGDYDPGDLSGLNETGCIASMGSYEESEHHMVAVFCDYEFIEVRKCCDKNQNLNLRYNNRHEHKFFINHLY